jgi:hypothetical protein
LNLRDHGTVAHLMATVPMNLSLSREGQKSQNPCI